MGVFAFLELGLCRRLLIVMMASQSLQHSKMFIVSGLTAKRKDFDWKNRQSR